jgi:signal transduction histidine kinase
LGLWISKVIIDLMGGDIGCVSSPEREQGTMFVFEIPLHYYKEINEE